MGLEELLQQDIDPLSQALVLMEISNGLSRLQRYRDARQKLMKASKLLGPNHEYYPRVAYHLALIDMEEKNWRGALNRFDDILESYAAILHMPDHDDLLEGTELNRAVALGKLGRYQEARPLLEEARRNKQNRTIILSYLGACDFELGHYDAAIEAYDELFSITGEPMDSVFRAQAHYHRGVMFFRRDQLARAKSEFEQCLACPDRGEIQNANLLGWLVDLSRKLGLDDDVKRYSTLLSGSGQAGGE